MKIFTVLRNNWKKSVVGVALGTYGIHYGTEMLQISTLMKSYGKEAALYGEQRDEYKRKVIVILNPAANKKKSEKTFKKYCEPILHLAGFMVDIIKTDSDGYAKTYMQQLSSLPNAIVIAGGDGTVSEVLTGMMRRNSDRCPIAVLPLGANNDIAKKYLGVSLSSKVKEVESLLKASMYVVRGYYEEKDVIQIEQVASDENEPAQAKPVYALGYLQWGISRDLNSLQDKYWYFGPARSVGSVILNAFNSSLSWSCKADVSYSPPCPGCSNCVSLSQNSSAFKGKWWSGLLSRREAAASGKQLIASDSCDKLANDNIDSSNVRIFVDDTSELHRLVLEKRDKFKSGFSFPYNYLAQQQALSAEDSQQSIEFRKMTLLPDESCKCSPKSYSIDNEVYDVRPITLTLIPKAIQLYMQSRAA